MSTTGESKYPHIVPVEPNAIPSLLKEQVRWIVWYAGPIKSNGRFDKIPCDPTSGRNINPHKVQNWLTFVHALNAHRAGVGSGIGFVLSTDVPITINGVPNFIIAIDLDGCSSWIAEVEAVWLKLGETYAEVSPSRTGVRMFALSKEPFENDNDGHGRELYSRGQFMTVTGRSGRGTIKEVTASLRLLHQQWFGPQSASDTAKSTFTQSTTELGNNIKGAQVSEDAEKIAIVKSQLTFVSADTDYASWRNLVWSVMSTEWSCAETIAKEWSKSAPHRYDEGVFDNLIRTFDPYRGLSLGTLYHHATQAGYRGPAVFQGAQQKDHSSHSSSQSSSQAGSRLLTGAQVKSVPEPPYRLRGLLPAAGIAAIYGEPGSGKSFLVLDMAIAIGNGRADWFGMKVKAAPVVYIALEGRGGVSKRIKAWEKHNQDIVSDQVRFMLSEFCLLDAKGVEALATEIVSVVGTGAVAIIDTLNQSAPGADENSSADMSRLLTNAKLLMDRIKGLVAFVHHAGKDRSRGLRGHSSLYAAMDAVIEVVSTPAGRLWSATKTKDDQAGASRDFELVRYDVDMDADGLQISSCAVRHTINVASPQKKPLVGKRQKAAIAALQPLLAAGKVLPHAEVLQAVAAVLAVPQGRRTADAKEVVDRLIVGGHLRWIDGGIALV